MYRFCEGLKGHRNAKEQWLRASQAIPLNIAEGNGKAMLTKLGGRGNGRPNQAVHWTRATPRAIEGQR